MPEADATKYGLAPWEAGDFFRVDTPKHTHRRSVKPVWRQKISVSLGNRGPGLLDFATEVGVVAEWSPPSPQSLIDDLDPAQIAAIKKAVSDGLDRESPQATDWAGNAVAKVLGLDVVDRRKRRTRKSRCLHWSMRVTSKSSSAQTPTRAGIRADTLCRPIPRPKRARRRLLTSSPLVRAGAASAVSNPSPPPPPLVLLCHDDPGLDRRDGKAWQHGQRMRVRASAIVSCLRIVAIEFSTCRSGRIGGASGFGTQG